MITGDYWGLLEITRDYWRLLGITGDHQGLLVITGDYYGFKFSTVSFNQRSNFELGSCVDASSLVS